MFKFYSFFLLLLLFSIPSFSSNLKGQNQLIDGIEEYRLYVKLKADLLPDLENDEVRFYSKTRSVDEDLKKGLKRFSFQQVFELSANQKDEIRRGEPLRRLEGKFDKRLFSGLLEAVDALSFTGEELLEIAIELESYDEVEYCEVSPLTPPPPPSMDTEAPFLRQIPDFTDKQFYLYGDQGGDIIGIYADHAWSVGITGQGVSFADIEWGWDYLHQDFAGQNVIDALTTTNHNYDDHGTGVLGEMYSADNGFGVKGCVYGADAFYGFSEITKGRPAAIGYAMDSLKAGDIIVYEMQTGGVGGEYVPADYNQSVWDITKTATEAGFIVVAAAGNGNQNLDGSGYNSYMARGDNGSIIVGAGTKVGRNKCSFSTYGSRVDVCGIGDWSIYTTGYGDLYGSGHTSYTKGFSGTSSSTPIVASAAIAVQSYAKNTYGETISPKDMRAILKATGTPQGTGGHIGPLPNVKDAFDVVDSIYGGGVTKYKLLVNNGSGTGVYEESENVSISANDAATGQMFDKWTGDVQYIADVNKSSTTLIMPSKDISITATYTISDTVTISDNYVLTAGWEGDVDNYGTSSIDVDTSKVQADTLLTSTMKLGTSNSTNNEWVWAKLTGYTNGDFSSVYAIEITYSSNKPLSLQLEQEVLSDAGSNYEYILPAGTNNKKMIPIDSFAQPSWIDTEPDAKGDLDLSKVSAISFSATEEGATTNLSIDGIFIYGFKEGTVAFNPLISNNSINEIRISSLSSEKLIISDIRKGNYNISIYNLAGKNLYSIKRDFHSRAVIDLKGANLSSGAYIVRIIGEMGSLTSNRIIR